MIIKHPTPLRDFDYIGRHYYLLTWCCDYRKPHFTHVDRVELVMQQFLRACSESEFEIDAYCFMPDHVHQLVRGVALQSDARRYITLAKQYSGYYFSRAFGEKLWQRYGHDRWLPDEQAVRAVVGYIIENPVKEKLVEKAADYLHTGSSTRTLTELIEWSQSR